jgi:hypothetical protein
MIRIKIYSKIFKSPAREISVKAYYDREYCIIQLLTSILYENLCLSAIYSFFVASVVNTNADTGIIKSDIFIKKIVVIR